MRSVLRALLGSALVVAATAAAAVEPPRRVVSINLCTDQLAIALADPAQIVALSHLARVREVSFLSDRAKAFPWLRGVAEEVLKVEPDLVLAGAFSPYATRALLAKHSVRIEIFAPVTTVAEARAEIMRAAELLGHPERGAGLVAEIDRALAGAGSQQTRPITALQLQRRGFVSGSETLVADLMRRLGIANAADKLGLASVDRVSLEAVLKLQPDMLILQHEERAPPDQGAALLAHPALAVAVPPERRAFLPYNEITCAGPALPAAIGTLTKGFDRVRAQFIAPGG
jgi:iron complex transport system substrate-binding protein